jgi:protein-L-isoaspartate(D-aspartate) O-methyltransferase
MQILDVIDKSRLDRIPDKSVRLLSSANYHELGYTVFHVELRLYYKRTQNEPYSIITIFVETNHGTIEQILNEGYLGLHALEEEAAYITSHLVISELIMNSIKRLDDERRTPMLNVIELKQQNLINIMKAKGFLKEWKVERAIRITPRHIFVPTEYIEHAYEDRPLPTKSLQTISQPSVVAKMTQLLDVQENNKILEIGCGSGWQSAILSKLTTGKVFSIERIPEIVEFAKKNHRTAYIQNVEILQGDGTLGLPVSAPFDRIIVTAACKTVPEPLLAQLNDGGILVAPVGEIFSQDVVVIQKLGGKFKEIKRESGFIFAPLIGKFGF